VQAAMEDLDSDLAFNWYAAAVMSLLSDDDSAKKILISKWFPRDEDLEISRKLSDRLGKGISPQDLRNHLLVWRYNSFAHHSDEHALIMYNMTSYMAHSCRPSASWAFGDSDSFSLRSIRSLPDGAELTISYLSEDQLVMSTPKRREILKGWLFRCDCERCREDIDPFRVIKCPHCSCGAISLPSREAFQTSRKICSVCSHELSQTAYEQYSDAEEKYIERARALTREDFDEAAELYEYAKQIFVSHWVLYKIEAVMLPRIKESDKIRYVQLLRNKICFFEKLQFPTYALGWTYEELADVTKEKELYERAYHIMRAVAGPDSGYTTALSEKWQHLNSD
jgi:hypothetical protein